MFATIRQLEGDRRMARGPRLPLMDRDNGQKEYHGVER